MLESLAAEKKIFLSRLRNPLFLIRHLPSLSGVVLGRYWMRLLRKIQRVHFTVKRRPAWLQHQEAKAAETLDIQGILDRIPQRTASPIKGFDTSTLPHLSHMAISDPEDYFKTHRWGDWIWLELAYGAEKRPAIGNFISEWIKSNTDTKDPLWETYSSCERVANLVTWISLIPPEERRRGVPEEVSGFLEQHAAWILKTLEYYGEERTNNHILNNGRALILAGVALDSDQFVGVGFSILHHMLPKLVHSEGSLRERSSHYQLVILNWLLDSLFFARQMKEVFAEDIRFLEDQVSKFIKAAAFLCDKEGLPLSLIGDISPDATPEQSARRLSLLYPDYWPYKGANDTGGKITDWYKLVSGESIVLANAPSEFPPGYPTHGHSDITSFAWLYKGQLILCDSGRYRYSKDPVSAHQRSAAGHNLPLVDGLAPTCEALTISSWMPLPYASAQMEVLYLDPGTMRLSHNGFKRGGKAKRHEREITIQENSLRVTDEFQGRGRVRITLCWHFDPAFTFQAPDEVRGRGISVSIGNDQTPSQMEWTKGGDGGGWFSPAYGQVEPSLMLLLHWDVQLPIKIETEFRVTPCAA